MQSSQLPEEDRRVLKHWATVMRIFNKGALINGD